MTITTARQQLNKLRILDIKLSDELASLLNDRSYTAATRRSLIVHQLRNQVRPRIAECVKFISQHS